MMCAPRQFPYAIQLLLVSEVGKRRNCVKPDICGHVINLLCLFPRVEKHWENVPFHVSS